VPKRGGEGRRDTTICDRGKKRGEKGALVFKSQLLDKIQSHEGRGKFQAIGGKEGRNIFSMKKEGGVIRFFVKNPVAYRQNRTERKRSFFPRGEKKHALLSQQEKKLPHQIDRSHIVWANSGSLQLRKSQKKN